jgi:hypothetical protein
MSSKSVTQSKTKNLVERQNILEVMMEALMEKLDKLSTKMISRHDIIFLVIKEMRLKGLLDKDFLFQMKV